MSLLTPTILTYAERYALDQFAVHASNSRFAVEQTYQLSLRLLQNKVPGTFVECGIAAGSMLAAMGFAMLQEGDLRTIHAFDSFQGIPLAGPQDECQPGLAEFIADRNLPLNERLISSGIAAVDIEMVRELWKIWNLKAIDIRWHPGWFQHTLPGINLEPIAFLRLDGDLYESTQCCLEHLYDFVVPEGIVFIDDYGYKGCSLAVKEFLAQRKIAPELHHDDDPDPSIGLSAVYWTKKSL
jgi:O-methyltransferase